MRIKIFLPLVITFFSFVLAFYFYPLLPSTIATHWGINGQANGFSSKAFGLFFMPVLSLFLYFLFLFLPHTDPYQKNFSQFQNHYHNFMVVIFAFFFYIYLLSLSWNLGHHFNLVQFMSPAFAILFFYAGILTTHARRNWFVGIRTPWTLSSEIVWNKTHRLGGQLFKIVAALSLLGTILPDFAIFLIIIPTISLVIFIFFYSYLEYRKTKK